MHASPERLGGCDVMSGLEHMLLVIGSISIVSAFQGDDRELQESDAALARLTRKHARNQFIMLNCPEYPDPVTGLMTPDPNCNVPWARIASGDAEVEAFQRDYQVEAGDIIAVYAGTTIDLRAVVFIVDFCGWRNPFRSAEEATKAMLRVPGAVEGNLQNYYETCSYGKITLQPNNVAVVGPIAIECNATYSNGVWTVPSNSRSSCGVAEQFSWIQQAEAKAKELFPNDAKLQAILRWPTRRVMVLVPKEAPCPWAGLAYMGSTGDQKSFVKTDPTKTVPVDVRVAYHELQHNMGLQHARRGYDEYGDETDPMGTSPATSQGVHCHNAPSNWRIGWATPVPNGDLTANSFTPSANRRTFVIPDSGRSDKNMVIVSPGSKNVLTRIQRDIITSDVIPYPKYFLSYRVRNTTWGGYDNGLRSTYDRKVLVHQYNGTVSTGFVTEQPNFITSGGADLMLDGPFVPYDSATGLGGGLRFKVISVGDTSATVEVCRMYSRTEGTPGSAECQANIDRDCDGLVGNNDPDCGAAARSPPTPPSPRSPPPPRISSPPPSPPPRRSPPMPRPSPRKRPPPSPRPGSKTTKATVRAPPPPSDEEAVTPYALENDVVPCRQHPLSVVIPALCAIMLQLYLSRTNLWTR
ncbi:hypothetical protein PLESTB_001310200 [Pleodorina starrii]|uniref:Peptidase M11 gametolysin domain-containing protein n=1 Tax=Pleodorina starrii TaxID=330485 RepID=A0A9W6BTQ2_9CHLO|nr:hypothetical protein PLESTB_001310200 [Pleodorina starrii]